MGEIVEPQSVLLLLAAFSRQREALDWARQRAEAVWGPLGLASERFVFDATDYYEPAMGAGLEKCFFAFQRLIDPGTLAELKHATNAWEREYAESAAHAEPRPLNLDPGYITPAKLVLASTKDHAHRLYLRDGIYAEVTLSFRDGRWQPHGWTYPDYRREDYHKFFDECRRHLRSSLPHRQ